MDLWSPCGGVLPCSELSELWCGCGVEWGIGRTRFRNGMLINENWADQGERQTDRLWGGDSQVNCIKTWTGIKLQLEAFSHCRCAWRRRARRRLPRRKWKPHAPTYLCIWPRKFYRKFALATFPNRKAVKICTSSKGDKSKRRKNERKQQEEVTETETELKK